jgi:hypothetical protein
MWTARPLTREGFATDVGVARSLRFHAHERAIMSLPAAAAW